MADDSENALSITHVNDDSVDGDDDARSVGSKRAKIAKSNEEFADDRLSELPDALLLHVLSSVCTKQAALTSVLSKRWQFLWIDLPVIDLREFSREIKANRSFVDCVGWILDMRGGTHLNTLAFDFWYRKSFASSVNLWVHFVVNNKVKDFTLNCRYSSSGNVYPLPQILYTNVSLTTLAVHGCAIVPQGAIEWGFLKSLSIQCVRLEWSVFENILSGCPVLEVLQLSDCWGIKKLEITSSSLTTLVIDGWRQPPKQFFALGISAPYIRVLSVSDDKALRFDIGCISSLVSAKVDYRFPEESASPARVVFSRTPNTNTLLLLGSLRSVKELELGPLCIAVLASVEEAAWKCSPSTRLCLTLTAWRHKRTIYGILKILESSLNLETLVIRWTSFQRHLISVGHNQAAALSPNDKLDLVLPPLCHLKNVNISGFLETGLAGESMLVLVQLLLSTAPSLEKMVISAKDLTGHSSTSCSSTDLSKIAQKLLSFPRASPKAVVMVH